MNLTEERRQQLRRRYLTIGTGEFSAAAVFVWVAVTVATPLLPGRDVARALWSVLLPLLLILGQGGSYWLLARSWVGRTAMPRTLASLYRALRLFNPLLLLLGFVGALAWWPGNNFSSVVVTATWLFAVVEYLNYFVVRLSYPPTRWFSSVGQWRIPQLVSDLRRPADGTKGCVGR